MKELHLTHKIRVSLIRKVKVIRNPAGLPQGYYFYDAGITPEMIGTFSSKDEALSACGKYLEEFYSKATSDFSQIEILGSIDEE